MSLQQNPLRTAIISSGTPLVSNKNRVSVQTDAPVPYPAKEPIENNRTGVSWQYQDAEGNFLYVKRRYERDGRKSYTWDVNTSEGIVHNKAPDKDHRVLYGLPELQGKTDATVLVVEGEKTADAVKLLYPEYACVTAGGTSDMKALPDKAWGVLRNRKTDIIFIPDHDAVGRKAATGAAAKIPLARVATIPEAFPKAWDLADDFPEEWDAERFLQEVILTAEVPEEILNPEQLITSPFEGRIWLKIEGNFKDKNGYIFQLGRYREGYIEALSFVNWKQCYEEKMLDDATLDNVINEHPRLSNLIGYDELNNCIVALKDFPRAGQTGLSLISNLTFPVQFKDEWYTHITGFINGLSSGELRNNQPIFSSTISTKKVQPLLISKARSIIVNPIHDYLNGLTWDGTKRLNSFLHTALGVEQSEYLQEIGKRFLVASVARAYVRQRPYKFDWVLMLYGGQGNRKSSFVRALFGEWTQEGLPNKLSDKDASLCLQGKWGVELAELSSLKHSDAEETKDFISREEDSFRPPYGKQRETFPRRVVFIGTTNERQFLKDPTGNRRFMPVEVPNVIDIDWLTTNRDQLWAEATALYKENPNFETMEPAYLHEEIEQIRKECTQSDILEDRVLSILSGKNISIPGKCIYNPFSNKSSHEFTLEELWNLLDTRDNRALPGGRESHRLGNILRKNGYSNKRIQRDGVRKTVWFIK